MRHPNDIHRIDYLELPVRDKEALHRSLRFFTEAFGWSYTAWGEDYADTTDSGLGSGLNADPEHRPRQPLPVIRSPDLEAAQAAVLHAGGRITREIFSFPGGRRFHFAEPSGNELAVWSPNEPPADDHQAP